jgi:hypothetical protein
VLAGLLADAPAYGAQRTFVSSQGSDSNSCALAAPCRSFAAAIANTDADGEIIVLDSAGYGRVTIDRSVSITAPAGVYAGISVFAGTNGIDVDGSGIVVSLRGLVVNGQGGDIGIRLAQGARLYIEHCIVSNIPGHGVSLEAGDVYITDSTIRDNDGAGIWAESGAKVVVDRSRIERNGAAGLRVLNGAAATVTNSVIAGNAGHGGIDVDSDDGTSHTVVTVTDSSLSHNLDGGIKATTVNAGSVVRLTVARSTIGRNGFTGVTLQASTGTLTALVTENTIVRNGGLGGITTAGPGVVATLSGNAISTNSGYGVRQTTEALVRTRLNNVIQDNATDVSGTLTFVSAD